MAITCPPGTFSIQTLLLYFRHSHSLLFVLLFIILSLTWRISISGGRSVRGKITCFSFGKFLVFYSHTVQIYFTGFDLVSVLCLFFDLTSFWTSSWLHCTHKETTQHGNSIYESQTGRFSTRRWGVPYQGPGICMSEDTVFGQPCFWQYPYCPWQYRSPLGFCSPNGPSWLFALFTRLTAHLYWCGSTNLYSRHSAWLDGGGKRHSCHNHPVDHRSPKGPSLQTSWTTSICCCISVICTRYFLFSRLSFFPSTERSQFQVGGMLGGKLCVLVLDKFFVFYGHTVQIYFTSFDLVSVFCSFFDSTHTKKQHNMATPSMTV